MIRYHAVHKCGLTLTPTLDMTLCSIVRSSTLKWVIMWLPKTLTNKQSKSVITLSPHRNHSAHLLSISLLHVIIFNWIWIDLVIVCYMTYLWPLSTEGLFLTTAAPWPMTDSRGHVNTPQVCNLHLETGCNILYHSPVLTASKVMPWAHIREENKHWSFPLLTLIYIYI